MALSCCKKLSALIRGITPKHEGGFSCLNCFYSYSTENKFKKHFDVCKNHHYCYVEIPEEDKKNIKMQPWGKVNETMIIYLLFIIYVHLERLLEKISTCHNNLEKSSTTKENEHKASGYSMFTQCS